MWKTITCKICLCEFNGQISGSHLKSHGLSVKEYEANYGPSKDENLILYCQEVGNKGYKGHKKAKIVNRHRKSKRIKKYYQNPDICATCKIGLTYEQHIAQQKFCSRSCSAKYNNQKRKRTSQTKTKIKVGVRKSLERMGYYPYTKVYLNACEICNKNFYWRSIKRTCCKKCKGKLLSKINLEREYSGFSHSRKIQYNGYVLGSPYELDFAKLLDEMNIDWIRPKYLTYELDGKSRKYYPDFLLENGIYIDTKNDYLQNKDQPKLKAASKQNNIDLLVFGPEGITKENIEKIMNLDFSNIREDNCYIKSKSI